RLVQTGILVSALSAAGFHSDHESTSACVEHNGSTDPAISSRLRSLTAALEHVRSWPGAPSAIVEHLVELDMLSRDYARAALRCETLARSGHLRTDLWPVERAATHLLASYAREAEGDVAGALSEQRVSLGSRAEAQLLPDTRSQLDRECALLETLARAPGADTEQHARVMVCASCSGDWSVAAAFAARVAESGDTDVETVALATHLLAVLQQQLGIPLDGKTLPQIEVPVDMWSLGDLALWVARRLEQSGRPCCHTGPSMVYQWHASQNPEDPQGPYLLGVLEIAAGNPLRAVAALEEALARNPRHVAALRAMGVAHEMLGDYATSAKWFSEALRGWPDNAEYHARLARVLAAQGQMTEAESHYDAALRLGAPPALELWVARFYQEQGACAKARPIYERLTLNEDWQEVARVGLAECDGR
ncbi:MAG: tetratricopeptide repeat protein, partial [Peptococcales bacterium]